MTTQVMATVVGGLLKPDQALPLADQTRVKLTIEPLVERLEPMEAWEWLKAWIRRNRSTAWDAISHGTSFMNAVDTNVYVCAPDPDEPVKQAKALALLD